MVESIAGSDEKNYMYVFMFSHIFIVNLLEPPDPPDDVTIFEFGARWIALRWTPTFDGNRPVTAFNIYIQNVNETNNFTSLIQLEAEALMRDGGSFRFNITDQSVVLPFIQYSFSVNTCNEIGCSDQSVPSEVIRTNEDSESFD